MNYKATIAGIKEYTNGIVIEFILFLISVTILTASSKPLGIIFGILLLGLTIYLSTVTYKAILHSIYYNSRQEKYFSDGLNKIFYQDSPRRIQYEINMYQGKRHGDFKEYYKNGQLKSEIQYYHGERHGESKKYYQDGQLKSIFHFKHGKQYGNRESYYSNGNPYRWGYLKNNIHPEDYIEEYYNLEGKKLKFKNLGDHYTFYNKEQEKLFEIQVDVIGNEAECRGKWKIFKAGGEIDYFLDFEDGYASGEKDSVLVINNDGSRIKRKFSVRRGVQGNFAYQYSMDRLESNEVIANTTLKGPPGVYNGWSITVKENITSIDEIIKFKEEEEENSERHGFDDLMNILNNL